MMGNGTLALAGGALYKMSSFGWLHRTWEFSKGEAAVLRFEQSRGGAAVEVLGASAPEALSLLLLLGWYVPVLADEDAAASAGAVIATM